MKPIYPDFEYWPNEFTLAQYDEDPTGKLNEPDHEIKLESSLLIPAGQLVSFYAPSAETLYTPLTPVPA
jgi:hypothetical protein